MYASVLEHLKQQATRVQAFLASSGSSTSGARKRKGMQDVDAAGEEKAEKRVKMDKNAYFGVELSETDKKAGHEAWAAAGHKGKTPTAWLLYLDECYNRMVGRTPCVQTELVHLGPSSRSPTVKPEETSRPGRGLAGRS